MKEGSYGLVFVIPVIVIFALEFMVLVMMAKKGINLHHLVTYAFSSIMKKKTDDNGATRWLLKDIALEDPLLSKVSCGLTFVYLALIVGVSSMFLHLLLIDISYSCDLEDKSKDCFNYKLVHRNRFSNDPVDCTSAAIQNGTVDVICYKIVCNAGLAMGASYGAFKISMDVINLAAAGLLMIKKPWIICIVRATLVVLSFVVLATVLRLQFTNFRVLLVSDTMANALQAIITVLIALLFVVFIPWKDLIRLKNVQNEYVELE